MATGRSIRAGKAHVELGVHDLKLMLGFGP